jgi:HPt (histidine-containing phosphotransfer) domain-containing protein
MSAHLAKPVDVDEMVGAVLRACGRAVPDWRAAAQSAGAATPRPKVARADPAPHSAAASEAEDAASRQAPALPSPVDWAGLASSLAASETFLVQLAKALVRNLEGKPEALRKAAQQRDHASLKDEAHAIKGIAGNVKAQAAYELAQHAESASKDSLEEAFDLARALAEEVERVTASALSRLGS